MLGLTTNQRSARRALQGDGDEGELLIVIAGVCCAESAESAGLDEIKVVQDPRSGLSATPRHLWVRMNSVLHAAYEL
jgi:hypothetical protein